MDISIPAAKLFRFRPSALGKACLLTIWESAPGDTWPGEIPEDLFQTWVNATACPWKVKREEVGDFPVSIEWWNAEEGPNGQSRSPVVNPLGERLGFFYGYP